MGPITTRATTPKQREQPDAGEIHQQNHPAGSQTGNNQLQLDQEHPDTTLEMIGANSPYRVPKLTVPVAISEGPDADEQTGQLANERHPTQHH